MPATRRIPRSSRSLTMSSAPVVCMWLPFGLKPFDVTGKQKKTPAGLRRRGFDVWMQAPLRRRVYDDDQGDYAHERSVCDRESALHGQTINLPALVRQACQSLFGAGPT